RGGVSARLPDASATVGNGCKKEADRIQPGAENLTGGAGSDTLIGNAGSNVLQGGNGADALLGHAVSHASHASPRVSSMAGTTDTLSGGAGSDGFSGSTSDVVSSGSGDSVCPLGVQLDVICTQGAVVTSVSQDSSLDASSDTATITVHTHVIDLGGTGLTKVALAATAVSFNLAPTTPTLVAGTTLDGDWDATFSVQHP